MKQQAWPRRYRHRGFPAPSILPSSIYEVLLTPAGPGPADGRYMCGMVRAANTEQVLPDEVLSDNAYYYHADTGEIELLS